jgi:hypothetical protein
VVNLLSYNDVSPVANLLTLFIILTSSNEYMAYLTSTVKSPNFGTAHNFGTAADNFCEALIGFQ